MGTSGQQTLHHFRHKHQLLHAPLPSSGNGNTFCYGCNLRILPGKGGHCYYKCETCSFSLHQACSSMPRKTRHPAHPNHGLTLLVSPPQSTQALKCKACGDHVRGFYYCCAKCGIYFHILCLALPLCVAISSHPHPLALEFSPPYDFCCDLCDKPGYMGWLYRCHQCEFDVHVSCAICSNPTQATGPETKADSEIDKELLQLVIQGHGLPSPAVAGGVEMPRSPKQELITARTTEIGQSGLNHHRKTISQLSSAPASPEARSFQESQTPMSEDLITIPSCQFSDFCFSIDLMKSPVPSHDHNNNNANHAKKYEANHKSSDQNPLFRDPENWLRDAFLVEGADPDFPSKSGRNKVGDGKKQIIKSDVGKSRVSCWSIITCGFYANYQKCSKSFKNGGL